MQNSRLFVKNLPKYVDEKRLREHFSQCGEVTDAKIIRNKENKESRQFGFVGFRSEKEAKKALKFFRNSFLDTRKLDVTIAKPTGDAALPKPWSRHSEGSSAHKRQHPDPPTEPEESEENPRKKQKTEEEQKEEDDHKKQYFMKLVKGSKGNIWSDDNIIPNAKQVKKGKLQDGTVVKQEHSLVASKKTGGEGVFYERTHLKFESDDESDQEYQTIPNIASGDQEEEEFDDDIVDTESVAPSIAHDAAISDLDYFRMKQKPAAPTIELASDDIEEEDDDEEENMTKNNDNDDEMDENDDNVDVNDEDDHQDHATSDTEDNKQKESDNKHAEDAKQTETNTTTSHTEDKDDEEDLGDSGRIFVRNLPYTVTEEDIIKQFSKFGEISDVHLPIHSETKQTKGYAFVTYMVPSDAVKAQLKLDNSIFQGRLLRLLPAKLAPTRTNSTTEGSTALSSFKKKKEQQLKDASLDDTNWNTIFLRQDTVASAIADQLNIKKSELFNPEADNMAVRMALAETQIIEETKQELEQEGVDLSVLKYQNVTSTKRSNKVILVKNLPYSTVPNDLFQLFSKFGTIGRIVLPSTKAIALVEFVEPTNAKQAFTALAYKRFRHVPLYLEWTPDLIFKEGATQALDESEFTKNVNTKKKLLDLEELTSSEGSTLYIKNLNFTTTEQTVRDLFASTVGESNIRSITIAKAMKGNKNVSLGYGFIEFADKPAAIKALKHLQGHELDDHKLLLKFSEAGNAKQKKTKRKQSEKPSTKPASSKIIIRNLAFEVSKQDLRRLCNPFGQIKAIRIPKKFDGKSRGYGFVEFLTKQDAKNAYEKLTHAHLYGRHLIIEYAKEDDNSIDAIRQKTKERLNA